MNAPATMPEWLHQRARLTPNRLALLCENDRLTFAQLDALVDETALRLRDAGVERGDSVALLAGNSTGFVAAVHAVARLGAVLMPLNLRLTPAELEFQLRDASARYLIHDAAQASVAAATLSAAIPNVRIHALESLLFSIRPEPVEGRPPASLPSSTGLPTTFTLTLRLSKGERADSNLLRSRQFRFLSAGGEGPAAGGG